MSEPAKEKRIIDMTTDELRDLIRDVVREEHVTDADEPASRFVTVTEAAKHFRVCEATIRNWVKRGAPARKLGGGHIRIELAALSEWRGGEPADLKAVGR